MKEPPNTEAEKIFALDSLEDARHLLIEQRLQESQSNVQVRPEDLFGFGVLHSAQKIVLEKLLVSEMKEGLGNSKHYSIAPSEEQLREYALHYLHIHNYSFKPIHNFLHSKNLSNPREYNSSIETILSILSSTKGLHSFDLLRTLSEPQQRHPRSLLDQLIHIRENWIELLDTILEQLLRSIDYLREVESYQERSQSQFTKADHSDHTLFQSFDSLGNFSDPSSELAGRKTEHGFTPDSNWMPHVVLLAKSVLIWLDQLSKLYKSEITRLDQIPNEELDTIAKRGFNALWLIGIWERSSASARIKQLCGNPDAAASAYSLKSYKVAQNIGGQEALAILKDRCTERGIRLAADMVPNHTGLDSDWLFEHPDWYLSIPFPPYSTYSFQGENLSDRDGYDIYLEDHYYDRSDAAVVFKFDDTIKGQTRYIYHGNDGTAIPWNDTAQLNYLNPELREAVIAQIISIAKTFSIIRFDAAMTLAKQHVQRLWFPEPGSGGAIASRSEQGLSSAEFEAKMPREFWRELVERIAQEVPETLLLAEAFWTMEAYFVRNLGMHRVYNSAFMNMLKNEDNASYRLLIRETLRVDPNILKRFVNFMNNPDEDTAIAQFGDGDKYFGVCAVMATMPGLPMFGHGQIEGFSEKYGMEFKRAYLNEEPRSDLLHAHEKIIFPLLRQRSRFSSVEDFCLYDFIDNSGINENVFAYSNWGDGRPSLVVYNNCYQTVSGRISANCIRKMRIFQDRNDREVSLFVLLYDSIQELWYIRSYEEVQNYGLNLHLRGYELHVFLDFDCVEDEEGSYARRCKELAGHGCKEL